MRIALCLYILLFGVKPYLCGQEDVIFLRDSIYGDRGISETTAFEPETRIYFPRYDEQGRALEEVRYLMNTGGTWQPQSRRMFTYEEEELTQMHIQSWNDGEWRDQRKDIYTYENGLLKEFLRQKTRQGQLENDRRWLYEYNDDEQQKGVLLQEWSGTNWVDLSRKMIDYDERGNLERQLLQVWMGSNWRNVRSREWTYEQFGNQSRVMATIVRVWSQEKEAWIGQLRKLFFYDEDGIWVRSRNQDWNEATQGWMDSSRMLYQYNEQRQPTGQYLQIWDDDWENRGQVSYTFQDNQFQSRIETWDKTEGAWTNFLRYGVAFDERKLLKSRIGMQAWNEAQMQWENRNFTQRYTHYWSESMVSDAEEAISLSDCMIPNPYTPGKVFFCDLPLNKHSFQLELYDILGRPVYRRDIQSGQPLSIDRRPAPGVYVLRIHDQQQLYHLQRLIIH